MPSQSYHLDTYLYAQHLARQQLRLLQHPYPLLHRTQPVRTGSLDTASSSSARPQRSSGQKRNSMPLDKLLNPAPVVQRVQWTRSLTGYQSVAPKPLLSRSSPSRAEILELGIKNLTDFFGTLAVHSGPPEISALSEPGHRRKTQSVFPGAQSQLAASGQGACTLATAKKASSPQHTLPERSISTAQILQPTEATTFLLSSTTPRPVVFHHPQHVEQDAATLSLQHSSHPSRLPRPLLPSTSSDHQDAVVRRSTLLVPPHPRPIPQTPPCLPDFAFPCQLGVQVLPFRLEPLPKNTFSARKVLRARESRAVELAKLMKDQTSSEWSWLFERSWERREHNSAADARASWKTLKPFPATSDMSFPKYRTRSCYAFPTVGYWSSEQPAADDKQGSSAFRRDQDNKDARDRKRLHFTLSPARSEHQLTDDGTEPRLGGIQTIAHKESLKVNALGLSIESRLDSSLSNVVEVRAPFRRSRPAPLPLLLPTACTSGLEVASDCIPERHPSVLFGGRSAGTAAAVPPSLKRQRPTMLPIAYEPPTPTSPVLAAQDTQSKCESSSITPPMRRRRPSLLPLPNKCGISRRHSYQPARSSPLASQPKLNEVANRTPSYSLNIPSAVKSVSAPDTCTPRELLKRKRPVMLPLPTTHPLDHVAPSPAPKCRSSPPYVVPKLSQKSARTRPSMLPMQSAIEVHTIPRLIPYPTPAPEIALPPAKRQRPPLLSVRSAPALPAASQSKSQDTAPPVIASPAALPVTFSAAEFVKRRRSMPLPGRSLS